MWDIKDLEHLLELSLPHNMHVYIYGIYAESLSQKWTIQPWIWFGYIDDAFFSWTASESELDGFLGGLNNFFPILTIISDLKFTNEWSREEINFLDVTYRVNREEFITDLYYKLQMAISIVTLIHVTLVSQNIQLFLVSLSEFVLREVMLLLLIKSLRTGLGKEAIQRV